MTTIKEEENEGDDVTILMMVVMMVMTIAKRALGAFRILSE